jgi:hypothetical protein
MKKKNEMARAVAFLRATNQIERHRESLFSEKTKSAIFWSLISFLSGFAFACYLMPGI